jgi:hypothetical protein
MDTTEDMQMRLYNSRLRLKKEMQRAIQCISKASKRKLAAEWKEKYSDIVYAELIRCAKNKSACMTISEWELEEMK